MLALLEISSIRNNLSNSNYISTNIFCDFFVVGVLFGLVFVSTFVQFRKQFLFKLFEHILISFHISADCFQTYASEKAAFRAVFQMKDERLEGRSLQAVHFTHLGLESQADVLASIGDPRATVIL